MKHKLHKQWPTLAKALILCATLAALLWAFCAKTNYTNQFSYKVAPVTTGWSQLIDGEAIALASVSDAQGLADAAQLTLCYTVPASTEEKLLFFYTKDVEVAVYLNDTLVYEFCMEEDFAFLQTPGNTWHGITLPAATTAQTVTLVLSTQFSNRYATTVNGLYLIYPNERITILLQTQAFRIVMSVVLFFMALTAYVNTFLWKRQIFKRFFFALGNLYLCTTLWLYGMYNYLDYFFHRPVLSYLLSIIMASVIPIAVYEFMRVLYPSKNKIIAALGALVWGSLAVQLVLQFAFGISMLTLLPLTIFVYAVGSIRCLALLVQLHLPKHRLAKNNPLRFALASSVVMFLGGFAELGC